MTKKKPFGVMRVSRDERDVVQRRPEYATVITGVIEEQQATLDRAVSSNEVSEREWIVLSTKLEQKLEREITEKVREVVPYQELVDLVRASILKVGEPLLVDRGRLKRFISESSIDAPMPVQKTQHSVPADLSSHGSRLDGDMIFVVDEAARALRCTTGAIAKHLKQLNQDGLVSTKRVGYGGHANGHGWCSPLVVHDDHRNRSVWLQRSYYMLKPKEVKP